MNLKQTYLSGKAIFKKNKGHKTAETIHVKTKSFRRLKIVTASSALAIIGLMCVVASQSRKADEQATERARLLAQINTLHQRLGQETSALDSVNNMQQTSDEKAMGYIESIEKKLSTINNYLSKRGLRGLSFKRTKPKNADAKVASEKLYSSYDRYMTQLVNNVAFMPMGYPRISAFTSFFGHRNNPFDFGGNEFHPGIDFRGAIGDPVKCTANGTVEFAGKAGGYGNCVRIKHINNIVTVYGHLSRINVRQGQKVAVGDLIGKVGSTGRSTGSHLHYEVRRNGKAVNPSAYLSLN